jgi:hypothetical protein
MNIRHAAALALVGWYLMVPPLCADHDVPAYCREFHHPVGQWTIRDKFATEQECNAKLSDWRGHTRPTVACASGFERSCWDELSPHEHRILMDEGDAKFAKCISSDDPGLKAKPN